jgi:hypothetical protein
VLIRLREVAKLRDLLKSARFSFPRAVWRRGRVWAVQFLVACASRTFAKLNFADATPGTRLSQAA